MKNKKLMWIAVFLIVAVTLVITVGTKDSQSQEKDTSNLANPTPDGNGFKDRSKYAVADYDELLPSDISASTQRKMTNSRYDGQDWVLRKPDPNDSGVGREDEKQPPSATPVAESGLIIVGEITDSKAHMSNDKLGVYTEFTIRVSKILKNDVDKNLVSGGLVTVDREGGYVLYPNGQKVFYENSNRALPQLGSEYMFFLSADKQSPNYNILTLYEFQNNRIGRLDYVSNKNEFKDATPVIFEQAIRDKILQFSKSPK